MSRFRHFFPILAAILSLLVACDDDPANPDGSKPMGTALSGRVTMLYGDFPVVGATVALVEAIPCRVVSGPVTTDADGRFEFTNPPRGDWYLFVFADSVFMFDAADARVSVRWGSQVTRNVEMIRSELWGGGRTHIAGRVTDARTGEPIEGAYVSSWFADVYHGFTGITLSMEDLTDADGHYSVAPINLVLGDFQNFRVVHPLGISKEGYAPFHLANVPVPSGVDTVYVLDVALELIGSGATVRGRVVDESGPLANIPVALDFVGIPLDTLHGPFVTDGNASNTPLLGTAMRTDAIGRFQFHDLAPATYFVDAAFLPSDGYVNTYDAAEEFEVRGHEVIDLGDIRVTRALVPVSPPNGAVVHDSRPLLRWRGVLGADRYRLAAGTGHFLSYTRDIMGTTEFEFDFDMPAGTHVRWSVRAYRTATPYDEVIADFEATQTFVVAE